MHHETGSADRSVLGLSFFPQQWLAVTATEGPVLVLAGPGAGKTRCLTGRIGYFVTRMGVPPQSICAITFTNKAAQEIIQRLRSSLGDAADQMTLGTIHSLCLSILRQHGRRVGLPASFSVADEQHQQFVLNKLGVDGRERGKALRQFSLHRLKGAPLAGAQAELFRKYERELRSSHLIDFDEILQLTLIALQSGPAVLQECQERWRHLLVDEAQDLDHTKYEILKLLAWRSRSLFAVGDDEQSIYGWCGADPRVLERLAADFAIERPILLDVNCRCSESIFETAMKILPPREPGIARKIAALRKSPHPVRVMRCRDEHEEMQRVLDDLVQDRAASELRWGEHAILYRTHAEGRRWEQALQVHGIPCQMAKKQALSDDPMVARVLAALRVVTAPGSEAHVERLASEVLEQGAIIGVRRATGASFSQKLRNYVEEESSDAAKACWRFLYQVENLKSLRKTHGDLANLVQAIFAQGLGQRDNPLEAVADQLSDPGLSLEARALGEKLLALNENKKRLWITPANGLEIPVKLMLQRALPDLDVQYLSVEKGTGTFFRDGPEGAAQKTCLSPFPRQVFKALQWIECRSYGKLFRDYVCFDTETTGTDVDRHDVIELAAVKIRDGQVMDEYHTLVHTDQRVPPQATAVHGYTNKDLEGQPTLCEVWPHFRAFVGNDVLIAHNAHRFDVPILRRQTAEWEGTRGLIFFDTLALARRLYPTGSISQASLATRFGVKTGRSHRALDDSRCLAEIFERLQQDQLVRARKTCCDALLDCVAVGAALEARAPAHREDKALLQAATWSDLQRYVTVLDGYNAEIEAHQVDAPPFRALLDQLQDRPEWRGARNRPSPERRSVRAQRRLAELIASITTTNLEEAVRELLDKVALSTSEGAGIDPDRVSLLTFHATKGLEHSRVYLVGIEDDQIPGWRTLESKNEDELREARRLLYVAMTRAKDKLTMTCCGARNGRPSRGTSFIDELGLTETDRAVHTV